MWSIKKKKAILEFLFEHIHVLMIAFLILSAWVGHFK
ncbi:hypothetical protein NC653_037111 [Populus alba x Populus x berolinensis]|uniref:Uncharacterized protein n=1 Tax=Populus alba x Populus x berolinensis TaxID=444605 RepID=A0AAD6LMX1_9ROSI|nr:hypothetical protein NC653_037111 [Populus alba x Populus x berolinensis]